MIMMTTSKCQCECQSVCNTAKIAKLFRVHQSIKWYGNETVRATTREMTSGIGKIITAETLSCMVCFNLCS